MEIVPMFVRSLISYLIFLATRKIVHGIGGSRHSVRALFKLHRCPRCWRLYSDGDEQCPICGNGTIPLYYKPPENLYLESGGELINPTTGEVYGRDSSRGTSSQSSGAYPGGSQNYPRENYNDRGGYDLAYQRQKNLWEKYR